MLLITCECPVLRTGKFDFWLYNINAQCTGDVLQLRTQIIEHIISDEDGTTLILSRRNLMQKQYVQREKKNEYYVGKINTWNNNIISCSTQAIVDVDVLTESIIYIRLYISLDMQL